MRGIGRITTTRGPNGWKNRRPRRFGVCGPTRRSDAVAFLLGLSDRQLQQMGEHWLQTEQKTKADGQFHTISALPSPGGGGFTILCGGGTEDEYEKLQVLCLVNKYKHSRMALETFM